MTAILAAMLLLATVLSLAYWASVWWAVRRSSCASGAAMAAALPSVSVLKPVKGLDADACDNFASFCRQDYPDYEILFGVADPADPIVEVVERLRSDFPQRKIRLVHVPPGAGNPKSASLHELAAQASGAVLVMSDGDVRVAPDYLRRVTAPLADPRVGAVDAVRTPAGRPSRCLR